MALLVSDELRVLFLVVTGDEFPDLDEDLLRALTDAWDDAARRLREELGPALRVAVARIRTNFAGKAEQALAAIMAPFVDGPDNIIDTAAGFFHDVAAFLRDIALDVEYMKYVVITELSMLAAEFKWALAMTVFFGAAPLLWFGSRALMARTTIQRLITWVEHKLPTLAHLARHAHTLLTRLHWSLRTLLIGSTVSLGNQVLVTTGAQTAQFAKHTRTTWTNQYFNQAAVVGAWGGLLAPLTAAAGHKLTTTLAKILDGGHIFSHTALARDMHQRFAHSISHIVQESLHEGLTSAAATASLGQFSLSWADFTAGASSGVARVSGKIFGHLINALALAAAIQHYRTTLTQTDNDLDSLYDDKNHDTYYGANTVNDSTYHDGFYRGGGLRGGGTFDDDTSYDDSLHDGPSQPAFSADDPARTIPTPTPPSGPATTGHGNHGDTPPENAGHPARPITATPAVVSPGHVPPPATTGFGADPAALLAITGSGLDRSSSNNATTGSGTPTGPPPPGAAPVFTPTHQVPADRQAGTGGNDAAPARVKPATPVPGITDAPVRPGHHETPATASAPVAPGHADTPSHSGHDTMPDSPAEDWTPQHNPAPDSGPLAPADVVANDLTTLTDAVGTRKFPHPSTYAALVKGSGIDHDGFSTTPAEAALAAHSTWYGRPLVAGAVDFDNPSTVIQTALGEPPERLRGGAQEFARVVDSLTHNGMAALLESSTTEESFTIVLHDGLPYLVNSSATPPQSGTDPSEASETSGAPFTALTPEEIQRIGRGLPAFRAAVFDADAHRAPLAEFGWSAVNGGREAVAVHVAYQAQFGAPSGGTRQTLLEAAPHEYSRVEDVIEQVEREEPGAAATLTVTFRNGREQAYTIVNHQGEGRIIWASPGEIGLVPHQMSPALANIVSVRAVVTDRHGTEAIRPPGWRAAAPSTSTTPAWWLSGEQAESLQARLAPENGEVRPARDITDIVVRADGADEALDFHRLRTTVLPGPFMPLSDGLTGITELALPLLFRNFGDSHEYALAATSPQDSARGQMWVVVPDGNRMTIKNARTGQLMDWAALRDVSRVDGYLGIPETATEPVIPTQNEAQEQYEARANSFGEQLRSYLEREYPGRPKVGQEFRKFLTIVWDWLLNNQERRTVREAGAGTVLQEGTVSDLMELFEDINRNVSWGARLPGLPVIPFEVLRGEVSRQAYDLFTLARHVRDHHDITLDLSLLRLGILQDSPLTDRHYHEIMRGAQLADPRWDTEDADPALKYLDNNGRYHLFPIADEILRKRIGPFPEENHAAMLESPLRVTETRLRATRAERGLDRVRWLYKRLDPLVRSESELVVAQIQESSRLTGEQIRTLRDQDQQQLLSSLTSARRRASPTQTHDPAASRPAQEPGRSLTGPVQARLRTLFGGSEEQAAAFSPDHAASLLGELVDARARSLADEDWTLLLPALADAQIRSMPPPKPYDPAAPPEAIRWGSDLNHLPDYLERLWSDKRAPEPEWTATRLSEEAGKWTATKLAEQATADDNQTDIDATDTFTEAYQEFSAPARRDTRLAIPTRHHLAVIKTLANALTSDPHTDIDTLLTVIAEDLATEDNTKAIHEIRRYEEAKADATAEDSTASEPRKNFDPSTLPQHLTYDKQQLSRAGTLLYDEFRQLENRGIPTSEYRINNKFWHDRVTAMVAHAIHAGYHGPQAARILAEKYFAEFNPEILPQRLTYDEDQLQHPRALLNEEFQRLGMRGFTPNTNVLDSRFWRDRVAAMVAHAIHAGYHGPEAARILAEKYFAGTAAGNPDPALDPEPHRYEPEQSTEAWFYAGEVQVRNNDDDVPVRAVPVRQDFREFARDARPAPPLEGLFHLPGHPGLSGFGRPGLSSLPDKIKHLDDVWTFLTYVGNRITRSPQPLARGWPEFLGDMPVAHALDQLARRDYPPQTMGYLLVVPTEPEDSGQSQPEGIDDPWDEYDQPYALALVTDKAGLHSVKVRGHEVTWPRSLPGEGHVFALLSNEFDNFVVGAPRPAGIELAHYLGTEFEKRHTKPGHDEPREKPVVIPEKFANGTKGAHAVLSRVRDGGEGTWGYLYTIRRNLFTDSAKSDLSLVVNDGEVTFRDFLGNHLDPGDFDISDSFAEVEVRAVVSGADRTTLAGSEVATVEVATPSSTDPSPAARPPLSIGEAIKGRSAKGFALDFALSHSLAPRELSHIGEGPGALAKIFAELHWGTQDSHPRAALVAVQRSTDHVVNRGLLHLYTASGRDHPLRAPDKDYIYFNDDRWTRVLGNLDDTVSVFAVTAPVRREHVRPFLEWAGTDWRQYLREMASDRPSSPAPRWNAARLRNETRRIESDSIESGELQQAYETLSSHPAAPYIGAHKLTFPIVAMIARDALPGHLDTIAEDLAMNHAEVTPLRGIAHLTEALVRYVEYVNVPGERPSTDPLARMVKRPPKNFGTGSAGFRALVERLKTRGPDPTQASTSSARTERPGRAPRAAVVVIVRDPGMNYRAGTLVNKDGTFYWSGFPGDGTGERVATPDALGGELGEDVTVFAVGTRPASRPPRGADTLPAFENRHTGGAASSTWSPEALQEAGSATIFSQLARLSATSALPDRHAGYGYHGLVTVLGLLREPGSHALLVTKQNGEAMRSEINIGRDQAGHVFIDRTGAETRLTPDNIPVIGATLGPISAYITDANGNEVLPYPQTGHRIGENERRSDPSGTFHDSDDSDLNDETEPKLRGGGSDALSAFEDSDEDAGIPGQEAALAVQTAWYGHPVRTTDPGDPGQEAGHGYPALARILDSLPKNHATARLTINYGDPTSDTLNLLRTPTATYLVNARAGTRTRLTDRNLAAVGATLGTIHATLYDNKGNPLPLNPLDDYHTALYDQTQSAYDLRTEAATPGDTILPGGRGTLIRRLGKLYHIAKNQVVTPEFAADLAATIDQEVIALVLGSDPDEEPRWITFPPRGRPLPVKPEDLPPETQAWFRTR